MDHRSARRLAPAMLAVVLAGAFAQAAGRGWPMRQEGGLLVIETPHYVFHTDHEPKVAQLVASHQETLFRELYQRLGRTKPVAQIQRMQCRFFTTEAAYKKAMGERAEGSQGLYTEAVIGAYGPPDSLEKLLGVFRHEGTHQFVSQFIGNTCPVWLNEGLAVYYQHSTFKDGRLTVGQVPKYRVRVLKKSLEDGDLLPLQRLFAMSYNEWNAAVRAGSPQARVQYTQAWSVVHFLSEADRGRYRTPMAQYMYYLARNREPEDAWRKTFGADLTGLQKRYHAYITSLQPTTEMTCRERMAILGKWIFRQYHRKKDAFRTIETFRDAAAAGKLGYWTITEAGGEAPYQIREPEALRDLFRCPDDDRPGDVCSYELVIGEKDQLPIVRCRHHAGYVLETVYEKDPENPKKTVLRVISKPVLPGEGKGGATK